MNCSCSEKRIDKSPDQSQKAAREWAAFFGPYLNGWFLRALVMKQEYDRYTPEDHGTWNILYDRQLNHLGGKAYSRYLQCVEELKPDMQNIEVADFRKVEPRLKGGYRMEHRSGEGVDPD